MPDFDLLKPPESITNPKPPAAPPVDREFPRHVYATKESHDTLHADGNYIVVRDQKELAAALKDGYSLTVPVAKKKGDAPVEKKGRKAKAAAAETAAEPDAAPVEKKARKKKAEKAE